MVTVELLQLLVQHIELMVSPEHEPTARMSNIPPCPQCNRVLTNPAWLISRRYAGHIFTKCQKIFLRDKPYNVKMQVKSVMSINEHVMMQRIGTFS